jgi:hypothetical protein
MGSDLDTLHGGTRELFMDCNHWVMYAGTYKCHDLREVYPEGTPSQQGIVSRDLRNRVYNLTLHLRLQKNTRRGLRNASSG